MSVLLDATLRGTVVLVLAWIAGLALRRRPAAARHLVWATACIALLALPLLDNVLPHWVMVAPTEIVVPASQLETQGVLVAPALADASSALHEAQPGAVVNPAPVPVAARTIVVLPVEPSGLDRSWVVLGLWSVGVVVLLMPVPLGWLSLWRLRRRCRPLCDERTTVLLHNAIRDMGLRRPVTLLASTERVMPMTWGYWRPRIVLPAQATAWPAETLRSVLLHELAHVRRGDCVTQLVAHLARALYWFHPLAWLALTQLRREQEQACDDAVLNAGTEAPGYAELLLILRIGFRPAVAVAPVALAMRRAGGIERRLIAILDAGRDRRPLTRRQTGIALLVGLVLLLPLAVCSLSAPPAVSAAEMEDEPPPGSPVEPARRLADVRAKLREHYVAPVDEGRVVEGAIKGMIEALDDPYSEYFTAEKASELERQTQGVLTGIGAQLHMDNGQLMIVTPLEDSPAFKAGLRPGDAILTIDGQPAKGLKLMDAVKRILGRAGTTVKLRVRHEGGEEVDVAVTRAQLRMPSVRGFRRDAEGRWEYDIDPAHHIGYVAIMQFSAATPAELRTALQGRTYNGLILDLRTCPGGLLSAAVEVAQMFLKQGVIVTIKGKNNEQQVYRANGKETLGDFPLLVLVNDQTASAGEIVAAALQDNGRATLLGTRTNGKGSVQQLIKLGDDQGTLKLTTAYHYRPSGRNIQKRPGEEMWGVDPADGYYVPMTMQQLKEMQRLLMERSLVGKNPVAGTDGALTPERVEGDYADPQLAAALKTMVAKLITGEFIKVGQTNAAQAAQLHRRDEIRQRRESLLKDLEKVEKELQEVEKK